jgi:hypothetical protein
MTDGLVHRVLAQVEVSFSNSMIEAFWRSLRHQWLYLHSLDTFTQLGGLIDFYVEEHNTQMPHHAFVGQTPDEVYFDQADRVRDRLKAVRPVGQEWRQTEVSPVACADHHSLNNP